MLSVNLLVQVVCSAMLISIESIRNFFTKNKTNEPDFAISSVELNLLFLFNILTSIIAQQFFWNLKVVQISMNPKNLSFDEVVRQLYR